MTKRLSAKHWEAGRSNEIVINVANADATSKAWDEVLLWKMRTWAGMTTQM